MSLLILSASDVDRAITHLDADDLVSVMARVFKALSAPKHSENPAERSKSVAIPHRSTITSKNHNVLFMPSRLSEVGTAIKIVSVPSASAPPEVKARGLPGSTMVIDETTGNVVAVVNARKLTALRNAASSLLATKLMLPADYLPRTLLAVGAGAQIFAHLALFLSAYPTITTCTVFNRTLNDRLTALLLVLRSQHPSVAIDGFALPAEADAGFAESVRSANIIITATSSTAPLFPASYVSPGTHLCLIGSYTPAMHEVDSDLIKRAGKVVVDYEEGAMIEAGELISAKAAPEDVFELGQLIHTSSPSSTTPGGWSVNQAIVDQVRGSGDVTVFKSVGVGVQDVAIAHAVVDCARKHGLGTLVGDYDVI